MKQQIRPELQISPELARLLREAQPPTEEELWEQRISFAYGNLALHNPHVTKEDVRRAAEDLRLRGIDAIRF
jgi:hypothetical protein